MPYIDEQECLTSKVHIFSNCVNLIRTIPALIHDEKNPNDVSSEPHELTHIPDAFRYFCTMWQSPLKMKKSLPKGTYTKTELEDLGYKDISTPINLNIAKSVSRRRR